jgi:hypoxanthine-DNA glycosylase
MRHPFEPVFDETSRVLVLGTFPSIKSREQGFYYGHPQNRFWNVISRINGSEIPATIADRKHMLIENKIALCDVVQSCDIIGSSDNNIRNAVPADISGILARANISCIYANGEKAYRLSVKFFPKTSEPPIVRLPSTSAANAAYSLERLISEWGKIVL